MPPSLFWQASGIRGLRRDQPRRGGRGSGSLREGESDSGGRPEISSRVVWKLTSPDVAGEPFSVGAASTENVFVDESPWDERPQGVLSEGSSSTRDLSQGYEVCRCRVDAKPEAITFYQRYGSIEFLGLSATLEIGRSLHGHESQVLQLTVPRYVDKDICF